MPDGRAQPGPMCQASDRHFPLKTALAGGSWCCTAGCPAWRSRPRAGAGRYPFGQCGRRAGPNGSRTSSAARRNGPCPMSWSWSRVDVSAPIRHPVCNPTPESALVRPRSPRPRSPPPRSPPRRSPPRRSDRRPFGRRTPGTPASCDLRQPSVLGDDPATRLTPGKSDSALTAQDTPPEGLGLTIDPSADPAVTRA